MTDLTAILERYLDDLVGWYLIECMTWFDSERLSARYYGTIFDQECFGMSRLCSPCLSAVVRLRRLTARS